MNRKRTILRHWLATLLAAVLMAAAPDMAWGQNQGVRVKTATGETTTNVTSVASEDKDGTVTSATPEGTNTTVSDATIITVGRTKTVTVTTTGPRQNPSTGKMQVAKVTVTKKEDFTATAATITGSETVNKNGTVTLTATVTPTYANTVVWTVENGTGEAAFVSGETTAATVTAVVNHETGQATAELKGLEAGTVTVDVKATGTATAMINEDSKTVTVLNPATITSAPTAVSKVVTGTVMALCTAGTAENGTMMYALSSSNTTAPAASSFSATLPKASSLSAGSNYYVWYYVKANEGYADSEKGVTSSRASVVNGSRAWFQSDGNIQGNSTTIDDITLVATTQGSNGSYYVLFNPGQTVTLTALNSKTIYKVMISSMNIPSYSCNPSCNNNSPYSNVHYLTNNSTGIIGQTLTITNTSTNNGIIDEFEVWYY